MLTARDIRAMVTDTTWSDGRKIKVLSRTDSELTRDFNQRIRFHVSSIVDDILSEADPY